MCFTTNFCSTLIKHFLYAYVNACRNLVLGILSSANTPAKQEKRIYQLLKKSRILAFH